jgi:PhnB protein
MTNERIEDGPMIGVVPHLAILDGRASEAIEFYKAAFGAEEQRRVPAQDGKRLMHASLMLNGGGLMLHDDFPEMHGGKPADPPAGTTLHLQVEDVDAVWESALAAGATILFPLENQFWGDRYGQLTDPFGHRWSIASPIAAA